MGALVVALVAGSLSTVNPCGFALLPAFLSFYVGADEENLPKASTRAAQGLLVGSLVSAGFLTVFLVLAIPVAYAGSRLTDQIPMAGIVVGVLLTLVGAAVLLDKIVAPRITNPIRLQRDRGRKTTYLFGVGYGIASLGCTLPVFLAVVGASLATRGPTSSFGVLIAYGAGTAIVLTSLSIAASFVREGLATKMKRLLPHMHRISGALLLVTGLYLTYYWVRIRYGSVLTSSQDPLIGAVERFSATVQRLAASGAGRWGILVGAAVIVLTILATSWRSREDAS